MLSHLFPESNMKTFCLWKEVDEWFANSGLGCKGDQTSQKPNLVVEFERQFKYHCSNVCYAFRK